ncbi:MAG: hypothetical protein AB7O52_12140 [Planctomycetota bacterium]
MSLWRTCQARWRRHRVAARARALVRAQFDHPDGLRGTSLRPEQRGRVDVVDFEVADGQLRRVRFTILRHPRPYPFSRQHHLVMQLYSLDVAAGRLTHEQSLNLSRLQGRDGEPPGAGGL